jgi:nucleoside-diphosphate-sugar epimerase
VAQRLLNSEAMLTKEAQKAAVECCIIRPTMIYGAGLDGNISRIAAIIDKKRKFVLPDKAEGLRAPVHADDVALAAIHALGKRDAAGKQYNIHGATILPYRHMVGMVFRAMGVKPKVTYIPKLHYICALLHPLIGDKVPHPAVALRMQDDLVFDDTVANEELGIQPRPFLQGGLHDLGVCSEEICRSLVPAK